MTYTEAQGIYYINIQIRKLESDLALAPSEETKQRLETARDELRQAVQEFEDFLRTVDDRETQAILRFRGIDNLTWREIGDLIHMDGSAVRRRYLRFFQKLAKNATK